MPTASTGRLRIRHRIFGLTTLACLTAVGAGSTFACVPGIQADGTVFAIIHDAHDNAYVGGAFTWPANVPGNRSLLKFRPDGSPGESMETRNTAYIRQLAEMSDGRILFGGNGESIPGAQYRYELARVYPSGSWDNGFSADPPFWIRAMALQPDGKMVVGGQRPSPLAAPARLQRYNTDGSRDLSLDVAIGDAGHVTGLQVQPNGSIVFIGNFSSVAGVTRTSLARVDSSGVLDPTFNPSISLHVNSQDGMTAIKLLPDGRMLISGDFHTVNGQPRSRIAMLHGNGALDTSFNPGMLGLAHAIHRYPDGSFLLGGHFSQVGGHPRSNLARLFPDGTVDISFADVPDARIRAISVDSDSRILIGGQFAEIQGTPQRHLALLDDSGALIRCDLIFASGFQ